MQDLNSPPGPEPTSSAMEAPSLNSWPSKDVLEQGCFLWRLSEAVDESPGLPLSPALLPLSLDSRPVPRGARAPHFSALSECPWRVPPGLCFLVQGILWV